MFLYNSNGAIVNAQSVFDDNVDYRYEFDETSHTNYAVFRINKKRIDGSLQYPFARRVATRTTAKLLAESEGWLFVANGGIGTGLIIENAVVIDDTTPPEQAGAMPVTIDSNGDLGYLETDTIGKGATYVAQGIMSALCGFFPIIVNYENFTIPPVEGTESESWQHAQRQIIGQFGNGDYMFLVSEGRSFDNSVGLTMTDAQRICKKLGVKFAYNLDGGGSTQTVFGDRNVNLIYEGTSGRTRGTFFVFNGTTTFGT